MKGEGRKGRGWGKMSGVKGGNVGGKSECFKGKCEEGSVGI